MLFSNLEAAEAHVGLALGETRGRRISQEEVLTFARLTGDEQWIHTDVSRAKHESPFGHTIVHGALTLALVPVLAAELFSFSGATYIVNAGLKVARLKAPLAVGAAFSATGRLSGVERLDHSDARVEIEVRVRDVVADRSVCNATQIFVMKEVEDARGSLVR